MYITLNRNPHNNHYKITNGCKVKFITNCPYQTKTHTTTITK